MDVLVAGTSLGRAWRWEMAIIAVRRRKKSAGTRMDSLKDKRLPQMSKTIGDMRKDTKE